MTKYNYRESICNDIRAIMPEIHTEHFATREELAENLNDRLWIEDCITGNASGSYTCNAWQAEENLCHNMDLLQEACNEFGGDIGEWVKQGAEFCDVSIRCYLLSECIETVLDEMGL